jgi:hypothetical protein
MFLGSPAANSSKSVASDVDSSVEDFRFAKGVNRDGPFPQFVRGMTQVSTSHEPFEGLEVRMVTRFRDWNESFEKVIPVERVQGASRYRVYGEVQLIVNGNVLSFRMTDFMVYENDAQQKHYVVSGQSNRYLDKMVVELMVDKEIVLETGELSSSYVGKVYYFAPNSFKNRLFKAGLFENGFPIFLKTEKTD